MLFYVFASEISPPQGLLCWKKVLRQLLLSLPAEASCDATIHLQQSRLLCFLPRSFLLVAQPCSLLCNLGLCSLSPPRVGDAQRGLVCCSPWGCKELDTTEELKRTDLIYSYFFVSALTGTFFVVSMGWEEALEKGKATHSSILAWRIPQIGRAHV